MNLKNKFMYHFSDDCLQPRMMSGLDTKPIRKGPKDTELMTSDQKVNTTDRFIFNLGMRN